MSRATRTARRISGIALAAAVIIPAGVGVTGVLPAMAATCKTTNSYKHTVTSKGTVTTTTEKRTSCGKAYQLWEHVTEHSYTGSHYTEDLYKDERGYPHYRETIRKTSTSAKGIVTVTYQVKTG
jgi:hypothetical protein